MNGGCYSHFFRYYSFHRPLSWQEDASSSLFAFSPIAFDLSTIFNLSRPSVIGRWSFHSAVLVGSYRLPFSKKKVTWITLIISNKARKAVHRSKGLRGSVILISCAVLKKMGCRGSTSAFQIGSPVVHPLSLNRDPIVLLLSPLTEERKERSPVSLTKHIQTETC